MTPFFFGSEDQRLFGAYDPPQGGDRRAGVVVCYPVGPEYYRAYPACRLLARLLSQAGMHVLRFDYRGTGDSPAEVCDVVVDDWLENISQAVDELKDMAELRTVGLVGLRFGSALAACAAQTRSDVDRMVLWDPIASCSEYLQTLAMWRDTRVGRLDGVGDIGFDVEGDTYTNALTTGLCGVSPERYGSGLPPVLIMSTVSDERAYQSIAQCLSNEASDCASQRHPGPSVWVEARVNAGMPVKAMRMISRWMATT